MRYEETAYILIHKNFVEQLDRNIRDELEELTSNTKITSAMDYMIHTESFIAYEFAEAW